MAKGSDKGLLIGVVLAAAVVVVGLGAYVKFAPADTVPREKEVLEEETGGGGVKLFVPYYKDNDLAFKSEDAQVPPGQDKYVFVVNRYLRSVVAVPKGAELVKCTITGDLAELDFNQAFKTTYGTDDESTLVNGVLAVMGQFPDVAYVKFLVEGKQIETLGNLDLIDPQQVTRLPVPAAKRQAAPEPATS